MVSGEYMPLDVRLPRLKSYEQRKVILNCLQNEIWEEKAPPEVLDILSEKDAIIYHNYFQRYERICGRKDDLFPEDYANIKRELRSCSF